MSNLNFNDADEQRSLDVIPAQTVVTLQMKIKPGAAGDDGWLTRSKDGASEHLNCEFTVVDEGQYHKRKVFERYTLVGTKPSHEDSARIARGKLRAILESARGIRSDDSSDDAKKAREVASWDDFDGIRFMARLGIEAASNGYAARNTIQEVITPDKKAWSKVEQVEKPKKTAAAAANPGTAMVRPERPANAIARPKWSED
jgi:hypothetical protein